MQNVEVALGQRSYSIRVGAGLLDEAGRHIAEVFSPRQVLVITDTNVAALYLDRVCGSLVAAGFGVSSAAVPPGETSKSHEQLLKLYDACFAARLERKSLIVALGGGVVGDLAGYVAATWLRGLPFVQAPTSLLAQVDSSVGGKTGINVPGGKNLVGAFHQPSLVLADVATLGTLDERQFATGMAEIVKHAMIRDAEMFERLESEAEALERRDAVTLESVVARNCRIKAAVVSEDEREAGVRAILNYGHTIGHAVEQVASYGAYTHGEAVALGMHAEAAIARQRGDIGDDVVERQQRLLERFELPTCLSRSLDVEALVASTHHDKKVSSGRVRYVLPTSIGDVRIADDVTDDEVGRAVESIQP